MESEAARMGIGHGGQVPSQWRSSGVEQRKNQGCSIRFSMDRIGRITVSVFAFFNMYFTVYIFHSSVLEPW